MLTLSKIRIVSFNLNCGQINSRMDGQTTIKQYALIYRCRVQKKPTLQVNMHLQKAKKT